MRWFPTLTLNLLQVHQCYHSTASGNTTSVIGLDSLFSLLLLVCECLKFCIMAQMLYAKHSSIWCNLQFSIQLMFWLGLIQSEIVFNFSLWPYNWKKSFSLTTPLPGIKLFGDDLQTQLFFWRNWPVSDLTLVWSYSQSIPVKKKTNPDINYLFKLTAIHPGAFVTKENMLTKLTCK